MLNHLPIFVNGFQRGGTNILVNLLESHPQVRGLRVETHEIFYGRDAEPVRKWFNRALALPVFLTSSRYVFWPYRYYDRPKLPRLIECYVDLLFYGSQRISSVNREINNSHSNRTRKVRRKRMLAKNVNGTVFATEILKNMYPEATFITLVRHGLAVCEGFMRRGWSPERVGDLYQQVGERMISDEQTHEHYHLVRFEDMIHEPESFVREVYRLAGLDLGIASTFRLQAKPSMNTEGRRTLTFGKTRRDIRWFTLGELKDNLRQDVNENQIARLTKEDKERFLGRARNVMEHFGYS